MHTGLKDILPLVQNAPANAAARIEMAAYTRDDFITDIMRLGGGKSDPAMVNAVVDNSRQAVGWLAEHVGVPFTLSFNRQAYEVNGKQKFWGGLVLSTEDGGKGLIAAHQRALKKAGVNIWFDTPALSLVMKDGAVAGVTVRKDGQKLELITPVVILAAGGFEANADMRVKHLGAGWENARVRVAKRYSYPVVDLGIGIGSWNTL